VSIAGHLLSYQRLGSFEACFLLTADRVMIGKRTRMSLCAALLLSGCASTTPSTTRSALSEATSGSAASHALAMVGKPYRPAGSTPAGFDCSGLVQYSYAKVGVRVPRDTQALLKVSSPVDAGGLRRGDLLFFDSDGNKLSHVGIYVGARRFVHAPSKGGKVRTDSLDAGYWRKHFVGARRL
jgi:cell wall-associated NlpC family hydrolase